MATAREYTDDWESLDQVLADWETALRAANKAPRTIKSYLESARRIARFLTDQGLPDRIDDITAPVIQSYFVRELDRGMSASTVARDYRHLRQLFRYAVRQELVDANPLDKVEVPKVPEIPVPVVTDEDLRKLLDACKGRTFPDRRDTAIVRFLLDTGARLSELLGLSLDDVDLDRGLALVLGKGRRPRDLPFGDRTAVAIKAYLKVRRAHSKAASDKLWIGDRGDFKESGVQQMLKRRCDEAGMERIHPHQLRHTFAHRWMSAGGNETDLMRLAGWQSRQMVERYGKSQADARAKDAHRRMKLGDQL
ncbi:MAG: tyrosine-type recombinase/integrase [Candidatus Nanopelagicales bacterium]